jgi:hypothetical protein
MQNFLRCKTNACNEDDNALYLFNKHGMLHKTKILLTFATINRLVQINHKINIKTSAKGIVLTWNNQKL